MLVDMSRRALSVDTAEKFRKEVLSGRSVRRSTVARLKNRIPPSNAEALVSIKDAGGDVTMRMDEKNLALLFLCRGCEALVKWWDVWVDLGLFNCRVGHDDVRMTKEDERMTRDFAVDDERKRIGKTQQTQNKNKDNTRAENEPRRMGGVATHSERVLSRSHSIVEEDTFFNT